jgi:RNA polymerase sigma-70 factor (ECF subfamily)
MESTSASLLQRLRQPADEQAWARFVDLYTPLLFHWARRSGIGEAEAADLIQDVFCALLRKMPGFAYDPQRTFRGWLRTVLLNQWRTKLRRRAEQALPADDPRLAEDGAQAQLAEQEYREYLIKRALQVMQTDFQPLTWQACWQHVALGRPVAEVAAELGMTIKAVYLAKARVLRRLREELGGLWD